ncbi:hypothetical protein ABPG77_009558 [Micractinium sp. CCAP 211/92]
MRDPLHQQTKLGAVFSPAQQHRSLRFAQLAAAYLGQPVTLVLLECLRLQDVALQQWEEGMQRRQAERLQLLEQQQGEQQQQASEGGGTAAGPTAQHSGKEVVKLKKRSCSKGAGQGDLPRAAENAAAGRAADEAQPPQPERRRQKQPEAGAAAAPSVPSATAASERPAEAAAANVEEQAAKRRRVKHLPSLQERRSAQAQRQEHAPRQHQPAHPAPRQAAVPAVAAALASAPSAQRPDIEGVLAAGRKKRKAPSHAAERDMTEPYALHHRHKPSDGTSG